MKLAQAQLLKKEHNKQCLFLLDDMPAELDGPNRRRVCKLLEEQNQQVFLTCIEPQQLDYNWVNKAGVRLFHVKHGIISAQV
jgi:DNA replication and repair protein RecF